MKMRFNTTDSLFLLVVMLTWMASSTAQGSAPKVYRLAIASQPLSDALQDFSRQSGIQVIFFSELTDGIRAPALDGEYTVPTALNALLTNSGLNFRVINPRTVEIRSIGKATPRPPALERRQQLNRGSPT
jgi:hypothetical protein